MGFLNNFAYGFEQTAKPMFEAQAKAEADADARIREKVMSVQPEAELFKRNQDVLNANKIAENKANFETGMAQYKQMQDADKASIAIPSAQTESNIALPNTTITMTPTSNSLSALPNPLMGPKNPRDMSVEEHTDEMNKAATMKSIGELSGNKAITAAAQTKYDVHKNEMDLSTKRREEDKNALTAADGINVPDYRLKKSEKELAIG